MTRDQWMILKYVMELLRPFRYWILWMSKRHSVTLHPVITVYNDIFDHIDCMMRAFAEKKPQWKKTCSSWWSSLDRCCPISMQKWLQRWACFWFRHIHSIFSTSSDRLESGIRESIWILRTRHPILPNTRRPFWSMWRMNTAPNINTCPSINTNAYPAAIPFPLQCLNMLWNHPLIGMICPAMMNNK
jgi:hypothetical protein